MRTYSLAHLSDAALLCGLHTLVARHRMTTAELLAHLAEVDERRLYAPAGYPSMHAYCVGELHFSDDAAYKRIQVARAGRQIPVLLAAIADGRLHMTAALVLAPHMKEENAEELIGSATHRTKGEIEQFLTGHGGRHEPQLVLEPVASAISEPGELVPEPVGELAPERVDELAPERVVGHHDRPFDMPQARMLLKLAIERDTYRKLEYARELLSHAVPSGDAATIIDRALDALITRLEKRKFAATKNPRPQSVPSPASQPREPRPARKRYIAAPVRRSVWERDQGQCTFLSESGHRCEARRFLEFDHVDPVARGGRATVEGLRLRCRTHNQLEAERVFGHEFMREKRTEAREKALAQARERTADVVAALRGLGLRPADARLAAARSDGMHEATLEERIREALKGHGSRFAFRSTPASQPSAAQVATP
ncbi:MAG: hypothetical protein ACREOU_06740 [Candidatus Eiseniibacteriota bacterium]